MVNSTCPLISFNWFNSYGFYRVKLSTHFGMKIGRDKKKYGHDLRQRRYRSRLFAVFFFFKFICSHHLSCIVVDKMMVSLPQLGMQSLGSLLGRFATHDDSILMVLSRRCHGFRMECTRAGSHYLVCIDCSIGCDCCSMDCSSLGCMDDSSPNCMYLCMARNCIQPIRCFHPSHYSHCCSRYISHFHKGQCCIHFHIGCCCCNHFRIIQYCIHFHTSYCSRCYSRYISDYHIGHHCNRNCSHSNRIENLVLKWKFLRINFRYDFFATLVSFVILWISVNFSNFSELSMFFIEICSDFCRLFLKFELLTFLKFEL